MRPESLFVKPVPAVPQGWMASTSSCTRIVLLHVMEQLVCLLQRAWWEGYVAHEWCLADRVQIPKEENSIGVSSFHSFSLLNFEGKILFGVITIHGRCNRTHWTTSTTSSCGHEWSQAEEVPKNFPCPWDHLWHPFHRWQHHPRSQGAASQESRSVRCLPTHRQPPRVISRHLLLHVVCIYYYTIIETDKLLNKPADLFLSHVNIIMWMCVISSRNEMNSYSR